MNLGLLVALENANKVYPRFLTLDHMGTPLKNQNFENGASSCIKLVPIRPRAKFHDPGTFGGFGKREQTHRQTHKIHVL